MVEPQPPQEFQKRWSNYYQAVSGRPPRDTLLRALDCMEATASPEEQWFAVDLGCGVGRDTVELLRRGWRVLGIDGETEAIAHLANRSDIDQSRLETRVQRFESLELPAGCADLINASFCLPFCPAPAFPHLWDTLVQALKPGGLFCGHLFGDRDAWAASPETIHHTRQQVEELLQPFDLQWFEEEEHAGKTALGEAKYWHLFNIVARKKSP